jgi:hypothetical protein
MKFRYWAGSSAASSGGAPNAHDQLSVVPIVKTVLPSACEPEV